MFQKLLLFFVLISTLVQANEIKIALAANVSYAINDLVEEFNKEYPNTKVKVILGSSGKLTAQINNGAPYDLFMSANMKFPNFLYEKNIALTKPIVYAQGKLALLSIKKLDFSKGIQIVRNKNIKRIAVGNARTAPYGQATKQALKNANLYTDISPKLVFAESISQTLSYTINATDLGFVAKSLLYGKRMAKYKEGIHWKEVNTNLYTPIKQGIVILKRAKNNSEVRNFYDFMQSKKAKKILRAYGYDTSEIDHD